MAAPWPVGRVGWGTGGGIAGGRERRSCSRRISTRLFAGAPLSGGLPFAGVGSLGSGDRLGNTPGAEDGAAFALKQDLPGLEDGIVLGNLLGTEDGAALAALDGRVPRVGVQGAGEGIVLSKAARLCWGARLAEVTAVGLSSARTL